MSCRLAIVTDNQTDLIQQLEQWIRHEENTDCCYFGDLNTARLITPEAVAQVLKMEILHEIAKLWILGNSISWKVLYHGKKISRITQLPPYPFEKRKCWTGYMQTDNLKEKFANVTNENQIMELLGINRYAHTITDVILTGKAKKEDYTELEKSIGAVWGRELGLTEININSNFFEMGGNSMVAVKLEVEMCKKGLFIKNSDISKYPSVFEIATFISQKTNNDSINQNIKDNYKPDKMQMEIQSKKKELDIVLQNEITTYLFRALPLCIILAKNNLSPWYYQHFTQICSQINSDGYVMLDYAEGYTFYEEVLTYNIMGIKLLTEIPDINSFLVEKINNNQYIMICLDEFYLSQKSSFQKTHFVHESLIYAYDDGRKQFKGIGFNKQMSFIKLEFAYTEVLKAFTSALENYQEFAPYLVEKGIQLFCPRIENKYCFDINTFIRDLYNFIHSIGDNYQINHVMTPTGVYEPEPSEFLVKYGFDVYDDVITCLNALLEGKELFDYRGFHLIEEHSRGILRRLDYLGSKYDFSDEFKKLTQEYLNVCEMFFEAKTNFFRLEHLKKEDQDKYKIISEIISIINLSKKRSKTLLMGIHNQIKQKMVQQSIHKKKITKKEC